jgi:hypothetical protein
MNTPCLLSVNGANPGWFCYLPDSAKIIVVQGVNVLVPCFTSMSVIFCALEDVMKALSKLGGERMENSWEK